MLGTRVINQEDEAFKFCSTFVFRLCFVYIDQLVLLWFIYLRVRKPIRRLINNPVHHGDRGWPPGLRPALYDEAARYYEAGMTPCESLFTNSHPKERQPKFEELKQPKTPNPAPGTAI